MWISLKEITLSIKVRDNECSGCRRQRFSWLFSLVKAQRHRIINDEILVSVSHNSWYFMIWTSSTGEQRKKSHVWAVHWGVERGRDCKENQTWLGNDKQSAANADNLGGQYLDTDKKNVYKKKTAAAADNVLLNFENNFNKILPSIEC